MPVVRDARSSLAGLALSFSEVTELACMAARGNEEACVSVVRAMYPKILRAAQEACARFRCGYLVDDLAGVGIEVVVEAIHAWDHVRLPFQVYALPRIKWRMANALRRLAYPVEMAHDARLRSPSLCTARLAECQDTVVDAHGAVIEAIDVQEMLSLFSGKELVVMRSALAPSLYGKGTPGIRRASASKKLKHGTEVCRRHAAVYRPWRAR